MNGFVISAVASMGLIACSATASAAERPFGTVAAVQDDALADVRGTYAPAVFTLTVGQMALMQDAVARSDFRTTASIGSVVMDNWWFDLTSDPASPILSPR